jgi:hypothetical protein
MTKVAFFDDDLYALADLACEGTLTEQDFARLEQLLIGNGEAQRYYLTHVSLDRWLSWEFAHHVQLQTPAPPAPALGYLSTALQGTLGYCTGWPMAYLVATAVLALGILIASLMPASRVSQFARPSNAGAERQLPLNSKADIVGRITGMVNCQWAGDGTKDTPLSSLPSPLVALGDTLALRSGLLEITYDTGAKVILQGPVTYEVESPSGGYLAIGKLTARLDSHSEISNLKSQISNQIPEIANHKFAVRTPTALLTDLGTEFGVEVSENGKTISHVFRGSVAVRMVPADGASADRELVLHENEAACIGKDAGNDNRSCTISRTNVEPSRFTRTLPESKSQESPAGNAYAEYVLSLKPAVYYRMEPPQESDDRWTLHDFAGGAHHGTLHCDKAFLPPPYLDGRYGKSLLFRGPAVMDHAMVPNYPKATGGRLTVSAWVKMTTHPLYWALIASNWGDVHYAGQFHFGLYRADGDLAANVTQPDDRTVLVREGESHPLPMGVWQHVAFVADGSMLRLYRNGVIVASTLCTGIKAQTPVAALGIGCKTNDAGDGAATDDRPAYWAGRIDELAIFNRALSTGEIKTLYEGGNARE